MEDPVRPIPTSLLFFAISSLALASCGESTSEPAPSAIAPTNIATADPFEATLQNTTDPDELLNLVDRSGGMAANMKNVKVSQRMAVVMKEKFESAPNAYELYKQYEKYALKGPAEMAYQTAKQQLDAKK